MFPNLCLVGFSIKVVWERANRNIFICYLFLNGKAGRKLFAECKFCLHLLPRGVMKSAVKLDVDRVDSADQLEKCSGQSRPVENVSYSESQSPFYAKCSSQHRSEKSEVWSTSTSRKLECGWRWPEKSAVWSTSMTVDVDHCSFLVHCRLRFSSCPSQASFPIQKI